MPQKLLNPADVQKTFAMLTVDEKNRELLACLHPRNVLQEIDFLFLPPGYELIRVDDRLDGIPYQHFELALINTFTNEVVYYNRVIITGDVFLNCKPVTQILIWRSSKPTHRTVLRDLPGKIFSDYLLKKFSVVVTDRHQTHDGMNIWMTRLYEALEARCHLYAYDMITCELRTVRNETDLGAQVDWLWGNEDNHQNRLAIISANPLPPTNSCHSYLRGN
ncbi:MAG TPA: hypothetical protein VJY31_07075 [Buttiauxella sp.]|nr:hypothetical protein [Buttiauxella sp.]